MVNKSQEDERRRKYHRGEYISRINRVIDYIESHYEEALQLEEGT